MNRSTVSRSAFMLQKQRNCSLNSALSCKIRTTRNKERQRTLGTDNGNEEKIRFWTDIQRCAEFERDRKNRD